MSVKNKNLFKIVTLIGFSTIALSIFAFSSQGKVQTDPETHQTEIKEELATQFAGNLPLRDSIESFGKELLGTPYVYGACSREAFDCSGFVFFVFKNFGIEVPRSSSQFEKFGKEVSIDRIKKGDILVFLSPTRNAIGHVGIVTNANGMESEFIHASSSKEMRVIISSLKQQGYNRRFVKAINVLGDTGG
jgi:cell wall-associated NlpC family hydrolase